MPHTPCRFEENNVHSLQCLKDMRVFCFPSYLGSNKNSWMFRPEFGHFYSILTEKGFGVWNIHHWHQDVKSYILLKVVIGCSTWTTSKPYQISTWPAEKSTRNWSQEVLLCADLVTPKVKVSGSGIKGCKPMVPTSMAGMKKYGYKVCMYMSNVKVLAIRNSYNCYILHSSWRWIQVFCTEYKYLGIMIDFIKSHSKFG